MRIEEIVGANVHLARQEAGLSRVELGRQVARWLGQPWPRQTVSAVELGRRAFTAEDVMAIALVLRKPVGYFFRPPVGSTVELSTGEAVSDEELGALLTDDLSGASSAAERDLIAAAARLSQARDHLERAQAAFIVARRSSRTS